MKPLMQIKSYRLFILFIYVNRIYAQRFYIIFNQFRFNDNSLILILQKLHCFKHFLITQKQSLKGHIFLIKNTHFFNSYKDII